MHFAKVLDGEVVNVIVVDDLSFFDTHVETEPGDWVRTSYNVADGKYLDPETREPVADQEAALAVHEGRRRKNYAAIGMLYDPERDAFYYKQPYPSWILNEDTCQWQAPIPKPTKTEQDIADGVYYLWDEDIYNLNDSDGTDGWVRYSRI